MNYQKLRRTCRVRQFNLLQMEIFSVSAVTKPYYFNNFPVWSINSVLGYISVDLFNDMDVEFESN